MRKAIWMAAIAATPLVFLGVPVFAGLTWR